MAMIAKLERSEGHLLNWYNIETLEPLNPRYVSTVDSGNLLGSLWVLERFGRAYSCALMSTKAFAGFERHGGCIKRRHPQRKENQF